MDPIPEENALSSVSGHLLVYSGPNILPRCILNQIFIIEL